MNNLEQNFKNLLYKNNNFQSNEFVIILDKNTKIGYLLVSTYEQKIKIIKHTENIKNYYQLFKGLFITGNLFRKSNNKQNIIFFEGARKSPEINLLNGKLIKTKNIFIYKNNKLKNLKD